MDSVCPDVKSGFNQQDSHGRQIRHGDYSSCDEFLTILVRNKHDFVVLEKFRRKIVYKSYRQPTQVGKSSRLRGASDGNLRNSAKQLGVILREALHVPGACVLVHDAVNDVRWTVYQKHRSVLTR